MTVGNGQDLPVGGAAVSQLAQLDLTHLGYSAAQGCPERRPVRYPGK